MNYAIILAGGAGTRFWPLSTEAQPKQFLNICSCQPLSESIRRVLPLIKKENVYIATNLRYSQKIKNCLKEFNIPFKNLFFEPQAKNTFPPIAVLSNIIYKKDPDAVIAVLPSDHYIKDNKKFIRLFLKEIDMARSGYIVTLGIPPTRPETGYGYIKVEPEVKSKKAYKIDKFIEKPSKSLANKFIKDKRYFWNGGIFVFRADVMLEETKRLMPRAYKTIIKIQDKFSLNRFWSKLPSISVDYAIMERTNKMVLFPADYRWQDLGSWQAIEEILKKDKSGNIFKGNYIDIASKNTTVWADKRLVATLGLNNIIIVDTEDALLVCAKDKTQEVKKIVKRLKRLR